VQGLSDKNGMQNAKGGFCGLEDVAKTAAGNYYLAFGVGAICIVDTFFKPGPLF
jgi:hypothetical protein